MKIWFLIILFLFASSLEELPSAKFKALKQEPCTFIHGWATWCSICIQELPQLLRFLSDNKRIKPVVIDLSDRYSQENFSKKWMLHLAPPFKTYLRPSGNESAYRNALDKEWSGALPYSALYNNGKKKKVWLGSLNFTRLSEEISALCNE